MVVSGAEVIEIGAAAFGGKRIDSCAYAIQILKKEVLFADTFSGFLDRGKHVGEEHPHPLLPPQLVEVVDVLMPVIPRPHSGDV